MNFKKIFLSILLIFGMFGGYYSFNNQKREVPKVYNNKMESVSLEKGAKVVYVWSSSCGPCVQSLAFVNFLKNSLSEFNIPVYMVLTSSEVVLQNYAKAHLIRYKMKDFPTFFEVNNEFSKYFNVQITPTWLIFNKKGELIEKREGFVQWNNPNILNQLKEDLEIKAKD